MEQAENIEQAPGIVQVLLRQKTRKQLLSVANAMKQVQDTYSVILEAYKEAAGLDDSWVLSPDLKYFTKKEN